MTDETEEKKNVFQIISGGRAEEDVTAVANEDTPISEYLIVDVTGLKHYAEGFLVFTSQHIAVMRDTGDGALPVLVMPLNMVLKAELVEDDELYDELGYEVEEVL